MTRDEAIAVWRDTGLRRLGEEFRSKFVHGEIIVNECAEDDVDGFIALGILKVDDEKTS